VIKPKDIAETEARNVYNSRNATLELAIWTDGSKLDTGGVGVGCYHTARKLLGILASLHQMQTYGRA
jgi:hypothetical protein